MLFCVLILMVIETKGDKLAVMEGDILPNIVHPQLGERNAFLPGDRLWIDGIVRYFISPGLNKTLIREAMQGLSDSTCLRFQELSTNVGIGGDFVDFQPHVVESCFSYVGKQGGRQKVNLHPTKCKEKEVKHELGHVLGLVHEHNRADRNDYLKILWKNIDPNYYNDFKIRKEYGPNEIGGIVDSNTPFDFNSLMLYEGTAFAIGNRKDLPTMTSKLDFFSNFGTGPGAFSNLDILELNIAYECKLPPHTVNLLFYELEESSDELLKSLEIEVAKKRCPPRDVHCPCPNMGSWYYGNEHYSYCGKTDERNPHWCPVHTNASLTADISYGMVNCSAEEVLACNLLPPVEHLSNGCSKPMDPGSGTWLCTGNICDFSCRHGFSDPTHERTECLGETWSIDPSEFLCSTFMFPSMSNTKCPCLRKADTSSDSGFMWIGEWKYENIPQKFCSDPSGSGDKWCPTEVGEDGNYVKNSKSFTWCSKSEELACSKMPGIIYDVEGGNCQLHLKQKRVSEIVKEHMKNNCTVNSNLFIAYAAEVKYNRKKQEYDNLQKKRIVCHCPKFNTKVINQQYFHENNHNKVCHEYFQNDTLMICTPEESKACRTIPKISNFIYDLEYISYRSNISRKMMPSEEGCTYDSDLGDWTSIFSCNAKILSSSCLSRLNFVGNGGWKKPICSNLTKSCHINFMHGLTSINGQNFQHCKENSSGAYWESDSRFLSSSPIPPPCCSPYLPFVPHGRWNCSSDGMSCHLTCPERGYVPNMSIPKICNEITGKWSNDMYPECKQLISDNCHKSLPNQANINLACPINDATCRLTCDSGYFPSGSNTSHCLPNGLWSEDPLVCMSNQWKAISQPHIAVVSALYSIEIYHPNGQQGCNKILRTRLPNRRRSHSSNFIDNILLVCGGKYTRTDCIQHRKGEKAWKPHSRLREKRYGHSSVVLNRGLYMIGGHKSSTTTEYLPHGATKWEKGFDLPSPGVVYGCAIRLSDDMFLITGGKMSHSKVMTCSSQSGCQVSDTLLKTGRYLHGCALVEVQGSRYVVVVGGLDKSGKRLKSTEILDLETNKWESGSNLKVPVSSPKIVVAGEGDVLVMGGWAESGFLKTVQKLDPRNGQWIEQRAMQIGSTGFAVSAVPVSWFGECNSQG